jgi:hypothetical protein
VVKLVKASPDTRACINRNPTYLLSDVTTVAIGSLMLKQREYPCAETVVQKNGAPSLKGRPNISNMCRYMKEQKVVDLHEI